MTKILVRGPALSQSGYGEHCRSVLRALKSKKSNDIYLINVGWGETGWIFEDNEERRWIDSIILKTAQSLGKVDYDVSMQVQLPIEWQALAPKNIGITAGVETDTIPRKWAEASKIVDKIVVPSQHTKDGYSAHPELVEKISVVGYPVKRGQKADLGLDLKTNFNFLTVAQWSPRKNVEQLISAFLQEFMNEEVGLVLKLGLKNGSKIDRHYTQERLDAFLAGVPETKCKIYLLHGHMTEEEVHSLYVDSNISAYVSTSHGEGFGLPMFEAATNGLPIITSNWGGVTEYTSNGTDVLISEIDYKVDTVKEHQAWEGVLEETASWCYPETASVRTQMREVYNNTTSANKQAKKLKTYLNKKFSNKNINKMYNDIIAETLTKEFTNEAK